MKILKTIGAILLVALAVVFIFAKNIVIACGKAAVAAFRQSVNETKTLLSKKTEITAE